LTCLTVDIRSASESTCLREEVAKSGEILVVDRSMSSENRSKTLVGCVASAVAASGSSVGRILSLSSLHMSSTSPLLEARTVEFVELG
jgi:hypothetical protein